MGFDELRAFLRVVDEGSFSSAADTLGVSRTTLRRQVDALEAQAGVPLLERNQKGVLLTDAGRRLMRGGRVMEQEFGALLQAVRETDARPVGELRLVLPSGISPLVLAMICGFVGTEWPGLKLRARFVDEPHLAKVTDTELAVWFGDRAPLGSWQIRTVAKARQRLLASREYLESHGAPQTVADLAKHRLLTWLAPNEHEAALVTTRGERLPVEGAVLTANAHLLHQCAHLGLGIAWVPDGGLVPLPGFDPLVAVLDGLVGRDVPLQFGVPSVLAEIPKVAVFLERYEEMFTGIFAQIGAPRLSG